jgi:hypothetical protein
MAAMREGVLTSSLTDELLSRTTLPMLVVREGPQAKVQAVSDFSTVLMPVIGTVADRAAQELAYSLAARAGIGSDLARRARAPVQWSASGAARAQPRNGRAAGAQGGTGAGLAAGRVAAGGGAHGLTDRGDNRGGARD